MNDVNDKILRLYTRLNSLKQNLPGHSSINEKYVREYHSIVQELESRTKLSLAEFKIADLVRKSHEARKKAKDLLEEAKQKVEKIILEKQDNR